MLYYGPGCSKLFFRLTFWEIKSHYFYLSKSQLEPLPWVQWTWGLPTACSLWCHPCCLLSLKPNSYENGTLILLFSQVLTTSFGEVSSLQFFILQRRKLNPKGKEKLAYLRSVRVSLPRSSHSTKQISIHSSSTVLSKTSHLQGEVS